MKKIVGLLVVSVLAVGAMLVFSGQDAFAYSVKWGNSSDDGRKGFKWVTDWLIDPANGGYYTDRNDAKAFAKTGYEDSSFYFNNANSSTFKIEQEIAGYANSNVLGYYLKGQSGDLNAIFNGPDNSGTLAKTFNINGDFGLYLRTPENKTWFTDLSLNSNLRPQALIYQLPDIYKNGTKEWLVAWEDLNYKCGSDRDFNDMYIKVSTVTPEPISSALFLLGGCAIAALKLRKKKSA